MIQVHTRDGIFGPGGYGGGVFDGSGMGFGALGRTSDSPMGLGLTTYAPGSRTIRQGSTGTDVQFAQKILGVAADGNFGTGTKAATIKYQAANHLTADGVIGTATWTVMLANPAAIPGGAVSTVPADDVAFLVSVVNNMLYDMGYAPISGAITQINGVLCGAADFVAKQLHAGNKDVNADDVADFVDLAKQYGTVMTQLCQASAPWPVPAKSTTAPPPGPAPAPPSASSNQCLVTFGSSGPVVAEMQKSMNVVLAKNGYSPIPVSGTWDAATCGAMFALEGEWDPVITMCSEGWQVPPGCPKGVQPIKPIKTDEASPTKTSSSTAWMLGGFAAAAAAAVYVSMKHR